MTTFNGAHINLIHLTSEKPVNAISFIDLEKEALFVLIDPNSLC